MDKIQMYSHKLRNILHAFPSLFKSGHK